MCLRARARARDCLFRTNPRVNKSSTDLTAWLSKSQSSVLRHSELAIWHVQLGTGLRKLPETEAVQVPIW